MGIILFLNRNPMLDCMHGNCFNQGHISDYGNKGASIRDIIQINASEGVSEIEFRLMEVKWSQSGTI